MVNQGGILLSGHAGAATSVRVLANYFIPYTVSSLGLLRAYRTTPGDRPEETA